MNGKSVLFSLTMLMLGSFSCKTISDALVIGCYQEPTISDVVLYDYDFLILHDNHKYSIFNYKKDSCDFYKELDYPYVGTWSRKGGWVYLKSYLQTNTKGWVEEGVNPSLSSDSLRITFKKFFDGEIDTNVDYMIIKSKNEMHDGKSFNYRVIDGAFTIKKNTDSLRIVTDSLFAFSNYMINVNNMEFKLRDSLSNQLDVYLIPSRLPCSNFKLRYNDGKLNYYSVYRPWKKLSTYTRVKY